MKLVDTSSWIDAMRRDGDAAVRARVQALMARQPWPAPQWPR
jgi:predicted nucleic acid-binding protein